VVEVPFACRIDAFDAAKRERYRSLLRELSQALADVEELSDGFALRFPARPYLFLRLSEWIELERTCCPFLTIRLDLERADSRFRVSLRGPEGVKDFLRAELPLTVSAAPR
jgi:hypothetical protein